MSRRPGRRFVLPGWLLIMMAIAAAGLYFGYRRPDITTAVIILFLVGAWYFWSSWHDLVRH